MNRDGDVELGKGTLLTIDNQINTATGTLRLKALFANPKKKLWPNQFVKAHLELYTKKDAIYGACAGSATWAEGRVCLRRHGRQQSRGAARHG